MRKGHWSSQRIQYPEAEGRARKCAIARITAGGRFHASSRVMLCDEQLCSRDTIIFSDVESLVCLMDEIPAAVGPVSNDEFAYVAGSSEKRRREFMAGRNLARAALTQLGAACDSLVATESRYPRWPDGYVGSISHNDELVAVAVLPTRDYRGLGIDLERCDAVGQDVLESILTSEEKKAVMSSGDLTMATVIFCCKEAIFKAVYPIYHEFLDFLDVQVSLRGDSFTATGEDDSVSTHAIRSGVGHIWHNDNVVLTLFLVKDRE